MVITSIEKQKHGNRFNVFVDGLYCFSAECDELMQYNIKENDVYDTKELADLIYRCQYRKALDAGLRFLSSRPRSEQEIVSNLKRKSYDNNVISKVISRLKELNYVDDGEFSRMWIEERKRFKPTGKRKLIQELKNKGVEAHIIDGALEESQWDDLQTAIHILRKRLKGKTINPNDRKDMGKLYRHLIYKGIGYDTAYEAVNQFLIESGDKDLLD